MPSSPKEKAQALADAVARNAGVVLSLPSAGMVRNYKCRFLDDSETGIWIEVQPSAMALFEDLIATKQLVGISFKTTTRRLSCITTPLAVDREFRLNSRATVPAVLVARPAPAQIRSIQRRAAHRVHVYQDSDLSARVWIIPDHAYLNDRPMASQEIRVELRNVSVGGLGVRILPADNRTHTLADEQRLRIQLKYREDDLLLDGRLRLQSQPATPVAAGALPSKPSPAPRPAGIVFKKLEHDLEGRQKLAALTRIIGELHRDEVRRTRLGLAS